jgi:O-antigen/teichoic acid export membrane protein
MKRLIEFIKRILKIKVFQNFSYLLLGNVGMQLLNLIAVMVIAKVYKPSLFGTYSFMITQSMLLAVIADLGMRTVLVRTAANESDTILNRYLNIAIVSGLIANIFLFSIYLLFNFYFGELSFLQTILVSLYSIVYTYSNSMENVFLGKQKMLPTIITNIGTSIFWLLFVLIILNDSTSVNLFFFMFVLIYILKPLFLSTILYNKYNFRFKTSNFILNFKSLFFQSLPFFGLVLITLPANNLANNFLAYNSTIEQVGFFSLSQKFISPITMVLSILLTSLFPNLSILWTKNNNDFPRIVSKSVPIFIIFGTFLIVLFLAVIDPVFKIFFSVHYYSTLLMLKFQIWYVLLFGVASLIGTILIAMHQDKLLFRLAVLNSLIITPILWIGSQYGGFGLSIGYLTGFVLFFIIEWVIFSKKLDIPLKVHYVWLFPILVFIIYNASYFYNL